MMLGIIGSNGFLGKNIVRNLEKEHSLRSITRDNFDWKTNRDIYYDAIINAAGQSKKYIAETDPVSDLRNNVELIYHINNKYKFKKLIHISSIDVHKQGIYSLHKKMAENVVRELISNYTILQCGAIIGPGLKKGVVYDILNDLPIRLTKYSTLQLITTKDIARVMSDVLEENYNRTILVAGSPITVEDMAMALNKNISKYGTVTQSYTMNTDPTLKLKTSTEYMKDFIDERME